MKNKAITLGAVIATGITLMLAEPVVAQQPAASPGSDGKTAAVQNKSLWQQISEGGWVMFPIGACSVLTVYFIVDGVLRTSKKRVMPEEHMLALQNTFRGGDYVGAYNYCKENPTPFTNVTRVAVSLIGDGKAAVEEGVISEITKEDSRIQTQLSYLSVIGVCAPMIGLLGTVTGMIRAFATLGASGIGDPSSLAAAIGEVLVATASGLCIAIPAFIAYYFLRNRAVRAMHDVEEGVGSLFRKMPYELAVGVHIGDEDLYAAAPNWLSADVHHGGAEAAQA